MQVLHVETSKDWRVSQVMWTSIGSPSKCVNRSDTEEKAVPLQQNNSFTRAGVGGSAVLGSFNCLKCLILSENPKECLTIYCTHAFSTLLEHQLHLTQTFRQMGSNRVKASPKTHSDLSFYFPGDVIFQAGPPDWKKREKKRVCKHVEVSAFSYVDVQRKHACSCMLGKFKRSA